MSKATADSAQDAPFAPADVRVRSSGGSTSDSEYFYRVIVNVFWYRTDGTVMGTAKMRVEWFKAFMANDSHKQRWSCTGHIF